jgi:heptaprenyl diphosphate synthase
MNGDRERVEEALLAAVHTPDAYLTEIASHLIVAGGKRLRPVFAVAAAQVGSDLRVADDVIQGAIACELVHLGSLYHDDVMDESSTRRGVETVNAKWGNLQAIVAGDFLLARASEIAASLGNEVAGLLARTIGRLCEGQVEELRHTYDRGRTIPSYLMSIQGKTASLFATSARIGSLVAGHDRNVTEVVTNVADAYGMVFQIIDDVLDIVATDEQLGKPAGHDLEEGVYTLPVLLTLAHDSAESRELYDLLGSPLTAKERTKALKIVRNGPGLAGALDSARNYAAIAEAECAKLPAGIAADALRRAPRALLDAIVDLPTA